MPLGRAHADHVGLERHRFEDDGCRIQRARVEGDDLAVAALLLDPGHRSGARPFADVGNIRRDADQALDLAGIGLRDIHHRLGIADARAGIGRRVVLLEEAIAGHADAGDHHDVFLLVKALVCAAIDEAHIADQDNRLLVANEFGRDLRRLLGIPGIVLERILDGAPVDAAIGVEALEVGCRGLAGRTEIVGPGYADDTADDDRFAAWPPCRYWRHIWDRRHKPRWSGTTPAFR